MYHPVGIQQLSRPQIKKLLSGGRVRVKAGSALKVHMVPEHAKKLASASKKGAGIMLQLDPYACDMNREHLEGSGVGKKIKSGFKKVGQFVKGNKEAFRPLATHLKQAGREAIADATMYALDQGVDPALVSAYSQLAQEAIPSGGSLKSFSKGLTKFVRSPAVKTVRKALKPLASKAFSDLQDVGFAGLDMATQQALAGMSPTGLAVGSGVGKQLSKFVKTPAVKTVRRAFKPLASKAFKDLQDVGFAGLDMATQQALGSMSAPTGMGVRGAVARAKRASGGALFPAGY
jgi:hypothetical protein